MMHRSRITLVAAMAPAIALLGCGGGGGGNWQGSVEDSAGVAIVTNTGGGVWGPGEAWTVEQELVIGTAEGEPDYQFGQIAGLDVGSDGRIYVMDQQASEVRVFSPEGEFLFRMGKAGSGPGELSQGAGPVFVGPGDTVMVPDLLQQRVTRYTPTGEPAGSFSLPMTDGIAVKWMEAPNQDLIEQAMVMALPGQENVEQKNLLLRRAPAGEILDTIIELPIGKSVSFAGNQPSITLFEAEPMWAIGPDGRFYFGNNSVYRLEEYSPDGQLQRVVRKDVQRQPVTEADQKEFRGIIEDLWKKQGMQPQALAVMSQALKFAEFYPAYANLMGGPEGTLWIQGIQTPETARAESGTFNVQDLGTREWEVYDPDGKLLGVVTMPPRFTPVVFHGDTLYGVLRDELDVQYAARMHVNRGQAVVGE